MCRRHYERWQAHGDPLAGNTGKGEAGMFFEAAMLLDTDDCILWPYGIDSCGYGVLQRRKVHVRACERAHGPRPSADHEAAHGPCHTRHCFNPRHVAWKTRVENAADKRRDGTHRQGEEIAKAKLTEGDVRAIRSLDGQVARKALAERYGISVPQVCRIVNRTSWAHLDRHTP